MWDNGDKIVLHAWRLCKKNAALRPWPRIVLAKIKNKNQIPSLTELGLNRVTVLDYATRRIRKDPPNLPRISYNAFPGLK